MTVDQTSEAEIKETGFKSELTSRLEAFSSAPILFVGSGVSRRYRNIPNWNGLLEELASYASKPYAYYRSSADGDLTLAASLMAEDLHKVMWESEELESIRTQYQPELGTRDSALKVLTVELMAKYKNVSDEDLEEELRLFKKIEVDAVITTNYDDLLESIFPDFKVYVGQNELLMSVPQGVGEIYKIHGSVEKPNSIVITQEDYNEYSSKYAYLAAKLMTFFAEHPIIFIGYSMSDQNIINILDSLVKCMDAKLLPQLQDRLIFIKRGEETSITNSVISTSGVQIPVLRIVVPNYKDLFEALGSLDRKFPAHILRRLKERVYELVLTNNPKGKLYVDDIEHESHNSVDVVLGVGVMASLGMQGYVTYDRMDICLAVLNNDNKFDAKKLLNKTIPPLQGVIPIIRFMIQADYLKSDGILMNDGDLNDRIKTRFENNKVESLPSVSVQRWAKSLVSKYSTFEELASGNDEYHTLSSVGVMQPSQIDPTVLKDYLLKTAVKAKEDSAFRSTWAKAVCLYDRLIGLDEPW
jgi:hypothetical protein